MPKFPFFTRLGEREKPLAERLKPPTDLKPYLTRSELERFRSDRATGQHSVFRIKPCKKCGCEIPDSKDYCSTTCYQAATAPPPKPKEDENGP